MLALSRKNRNGPGSHSNDALALAPKELEPFGGLVTLDLSDGRTSDARARVESRLKDQPRDPRLWLLKRESFGHRWRRRGDGTLPP
jgi:hypothetical protein